MERIDKMDTEFHQSKICRWYVIAYVAKNKINLSLTTWHSNCLLRVKNISPLF